MNTPETQPEMSAVAVIWELNRAARYLNWWNRRPKRALSLVENLHDWQPKPEVTVEQETMLRSMIAAVTADSYLALKRYTEAADWYRQAATFSKLTGFGTIYADLVLQHGLTDHYASALASADASRKAWLDRPLLQRIFYRVVSPWWLDVQMWRLTLTESRIIQDLKDRIDSSANS